VLVQVAEDGDDVTNATAIWPETRQLVDFGTLTPLL
jgi:catalase